VALVIPILNAEPFLDRMIPALEAQTLRPERILVIDSSSTDNAPARFREFGAEVETIARADFDHGGTRQEALEKLTGAEIVIFMTQDAIPAGPEALERLVAAFQDPRAGVAYGRQLPHPEATSISAHGRLFNYPPDSHVRSKSDISRYGIMTAFCSNSFSAFRRLALLDAGGFPRRLILSEDALAAAALLQDGWTNHYVAEACVFHSHNYSLVEEFQRYFDIGVMHGQNSEYLKTFGRPEGQGRRFVVSEFHYLAARAPHLVPAALLRTLSKYSGYRLGGIESHLPLSLKRRLSLHKRHWR